MVAHHHQKRVLNQQGRDLRVHPLHRNEHPGTTPGAIAVGILDVEQEKGHACLTVWPGGGPVAGTAQRVGKNSFLFSCKDRACNAYSTLSGRLVSLMLRASIVLYTEPTVSHTSTHLKNSTLISRRTRVRAGPHLILTLLVPEGVVKVSLSTSWRQV
jgi:hypothetical protein